MNKGRKRAYEQGNFKWARLETMAPTLAYDSEIIGDIGRGGKIPVDQANRVTVPALVLTGGADYPWMTDVGKRLAEVMPMDAIMS